MHKTTIVIMFLIQVISFHVAHSSQDRGCTIGTTTYKSCTEMFDTNNSNESVDCGDNPKDDFGDLTILSCQSSDGTLLECRLLSAEGGEVQCFLAN
ncbi:MAG: hypothetical protein ISR65_08410 [Bacteriovoracaceae bacterium]|nr:hypothetical protein [Bacteriovoracaceae bacterium]